MGGKYTAECKFCSLTKKVMADSEAAPLHRGIAGIKVETIKALTAPGLRKVIEAAGNEPAAAESPEQYAAFVRRENDKWREIVKVSGIKPE